MIKEEVDADKDAKERRQNKKKAEPKTEYRVSGVSGGEADFTDSKMV